MSAAEKIILSPANYFAFDRGSRVRHEFYCGEVFAMAGASRAHNLIAVNLAAELRSRLKDKPCEVYAGEMRVSVVADGQYTYPDVVVVCGGPQFRDGETDTLLNPTVLIEILSPSTEAYDRGLKFVNSRRLPSLREYVFVSQDRMLVERHSRENGRWVLTESSGAEASLVLDAIGCEVPLSEIYDRVCLDDSPGASPG